MVHAEPRPVNDRPRTERQRITDAVLVCRAAVAEAERRYRQAPSDERQAELERARRELAVLERRMLQVNV